MHASSAASTNGIKYTGREQDLEDLYYYRNRYYKPSVGRFISEDPLGLAGGSNIYIYVENNPVNLVDRDGLRGMRGGRYDSPYGRPGGYEHGKLPPMDPFLEGSKGRTIKEGKGSGLRQRVRSCVVHNQVFVLEKCTMQDLTLFVLIVTT